MVNQGYLSIATNGSGYSVTETVGYSYIQFGRGYDKTLLGCIKYMRSKIKKLKQ